MMHSFFDVRSLSTLYKRKNQDIINVSTGNFLLMSDQKIIPRYSCLDDAFCLVNQCFRYDVQLISIFERFFVDS